MASFLFRLIRVLIVLGLALACAYWLYTTRNRPEKHQVVHTPPGVRVIKATAVTDTMTVEAFGTVMPRKEVTLAAEVAGRIDDLHPAFKEGGAVLAGDLLVRMDQRAFILERDAAMARVRQAEADITRLSREIENYQTDVALAEQNLALTEKEWERIKALGQNQFASKTSVDKAEQLYLAARIQLQSARNRLALTPSMMAQLQATLALAQNNLDKARLVLAKSEIRAGFDGYVLTKKGEIGEFVNPGQSLGTLYEKGALDVDVRIPLEQLAWIKTLFDQGQHPGAEVRIANFDGGGHWSARVVRIKANIDEKTRTLPITLEIGGAAGGPPEALSSATLLKPGTFVSCRIMGETYERIFVLPRFLVHGDDSLYLVRENKLAIQKVTVLRKHEDKVFISQGLSDGDLVVASPLPGAAEGMALTVKSEGAAQ